MAANHSRFSESDPAVNPGIPLRLPAQLLLVVLCLTASIARLPLIENLESVRLAIFLAGAAGSVFLWFVAPFRSVLAVSTMLVGIVLLFKIVFGSLVAHVKSGQPILLGVQEGRFSLLLAAAPLFFVLFRYASSVQLSAIAGLYLSLLLLLDYMVLALTADLQLLSLGSRTDARFLVSVVFPWALLGVVALRACAEARSVPLFVPLSATAMALHSYFVSTSRLELILSLGLLGLCMMQMRQIFRLGLYALTAIGALWLIVLLFGASAEQVAGRDYVRAVELVFEVGLLGLGVIQDETARLMFGLPTSFYISDYGMLLYLLRYGVLGVAFVVGLAVFWFLFTVSLSRNRGFLVLAGALLAYLVYVPVLDYGGFTGSVLFGFMWWCISSSRSRQAARAPELVVVNETA
jgi:hypothetical protein